MYKLFLDDERDPPGNRWQWVIARDFTDVELAVWRNGLPEYISFDHDLGENEKTGLDIAKWLVDLDMAENSEFQFPENFDFYVHSQNPVGKANIEGYMRNYLDFKSKNK